MPLPAEVPGLNGQRVLGVACGESHGVAVMQDGCVWSWGCGRAGQLGRGSDGPRGEPLRLAALVNGSTGVRQVACGADCSMAVTQGGALLVWGDLSWYPSPPFCDASWYHEGPDRVLYVYGRAGVAQRSPAGIAQRMKGALTSGQAAGSKVASEGEGSWCPWRGSRE